MEINIYLLLGCNIGNRKSNLTRAITLIKEAGIKVKKCSSIYKTAAWGITDQADFFNQVLITETDHPPLELLAVLLSIEKSMGRERKVKWGPRLIDIDILFFGDIAIESSILTIPHPELHNRRFTLQPLYEIAPDLIHPILNKTIEELLAICPDSGQISIEETSASL